MSLRYLPVSLLATWIFVSRPARANSRYPLAGQIVAAPGAPSKLVARATFGLLSSSDAGKTWTWVCESAVGYFGAEDPPIAVTADGSTLVASSQGILVSHDDGCSWSKNPGLDIHPIAIDVTIQPADAHQAFALVSQSLDGNYNISVLRTDDDGRTFHETGPALPTGITAETVEVAPSDPLRIYVSAKVYSTQQAILERSDDGGASFVAFPLDVRGPAGIYIGAVDPTDPNVVYLRTTSSTDGSRVILTRDGGQTFRDVWTGPGDVPGFSLSPDGSTLALGGPMTGIDIASTADFAFQMTSSFEPYCLAWHDSDLLACGNEAKAGFSIGVSRDQAVHFEPLLHLADVTPQSCPKGSSAEGCATQWGAVALQLGIDAGGSAPVGPINPELNPVSDSGKKGCSCRLPGRVSDHSAVTPAISVTALFAYMRARRARKRGVHRVG